MQPKILDWQKVVRLAPTLIRKRMRLQKESGTTYHGRITTLLTSQKQVFFIATKNRKMVIEGKSVAVLDYTPVDVRKGEGKPKSCTPIVRKNGKVYISCTEGVVVIY